MGQSGVWWRPQGRAEAVPRGLACPGQAGRGGRSGKGLLGRGGLGRAWLCGGGRALSRCSRPSGAAEPRRRIPAAVLLIRNIGRPHCCGGEGRGGAKRGEAAVEGRPGRCGAGNSRLAGRDGQRWGRVGRVGGGAVRRGPGCGGLAGWGVPGMHKASRSSSSDGTPLFPVFPPPQPSGEQPPGGTGWAAAVRVTTAEILPCY